MAGGATLAAAVAIGALVGPAQVAGRLLEFGLLRHVHPLLSARLATLMHPIGALALAAFGATGAAAFALLHGAGNGILTIAKGTLPLVLFGLCVDRWGADALWLSSALGVVAFSALMFLRREAARPDSPSVAVSTGARGRPESCPRSPGNGRSSGNDDSKTDHGRTAAGERQPGVSRTGARVIAAAPLQWSR